MFYALTGMSQRRVKATACLVVLSIVFLTFFPARISAQQVPLTILHTNDTHGHLLPFSYPSVVPPGSELAALKVRRDIGGIARRATLVKRLREELGRRGTTVWLVDAGDFTDGTPFTIEYHGAADIAAMNAAGYTFGTLGNHEFNNPLERMRLLLGQFTYPILNANAVETASGGLLARASEIRKLGPLKIGIFGIVTHEARTYPAGRESVTIADEIETAQRMTKTLRPQANIILLISHAGEEMDEQIAKAAPGIDIIVGGHSHSRLPSGEFMWRSDELKPKEVNGTIIVQAHKWGGEVGRLDLLFDRDERGAWRVERFRSRLIPVTPDIGEDKSVAAVVDRFWKPIAARYGEIIGQAAGDFSQRGDDLEPHNLVTDAIRETIGTEVVLEDDSSLQAPLIRGNITAGDLAMMDPYDNTIVTFKMAGRQLKEILVKERPAVSGLRYRLENGVLSEVTVGGQPIDESRLYTVATNSFYAAIAMKGVEVVNTKRLRREMIANYIHTKGVVRPLFDGRRVVIDSGQ
jgi:5'-nucleotidase/UDP-sugar diphosphatase